MASVDIPLMAHLMRRAGFGATREELESLVARGYEATVEELLHPETAPPMQDDDLIRRYHDNAVLQGETCQSYWIHRMINTQRPLEEKLALFWHGIFATAYAKLIQPKVILKQIEMFRRCGMGSFRDLLIELSKDPAMIFWLDNKDNHKDAVNENYGRELLELFSMGVGNYTEDDVRQASRAFTGWTILNASYHSVRQAQDSVWPYGRLDWQFQYRDDDHDDGEKTFLGNTGPFNGQDIIDIICRQPATAGFIARHMYNFFVADEPQVPAWQTVPPRDPETVNTLANAFFEYKYDIRSVLRVLFNSDFFKNSAFAKVKSPAELVVGAVRLVGGRSFPAVDDIDLVLQMANMGQRLIDPPSVEGWHTGTEWIDTGSLVERVNFAVDRLTQTDNPWVASITERIVAQGLTVSPEHLVDSCLDLAGPLTVSGNTRQGLVAHATQGGDLEFGSEEGRRSASERIKEMLQLIVSTREYQLA